VAKRHHLQSWSPKKNQTINHSIYIHYM
jgi:hypothetical protein